MHRRHGCKDRFHEKYAEPQVQIAMLCIVAVKNMSKILQCEKNLMRSQVIQTKNKHILGKRHLEHVNRDVNALLPYHHLGVVDSTNYFACSPSYYNESRLVPGIHHVSDLVHYCLQGLTHNITSQRCLKYQKSSMRWKT